jgi:hypothetical protein
MVLHRCGTGNEIALAYLGRTALLHSLRVPMLVDYLPSGLNYTRLKNAQPPYTVFSCAPVVELPR